MPSISSVPVALIVAVARNGVIGRDNTLPWRLPADLKHFKATTLGKPIVMGRKTFESLGKPLPGRTNIVITRDRNFAADGAVIVHSLEEALGEAAAVAARDGAAEVMVIGGAEIYRQALLLAQTVYYTRVLLDVEGDAFFPELDAGQWQCIDRQQFVAEGDCPAYEFLRYRRLTDN
jgi:dihydrofolate reductase